jgi:hypothetical protein
MALLLQYGIELDRVILREGAIMTSEDTLFYL